MLIKKFKIIISYDGTSYSGWQSQLAEHGLAVQDVLISSFFRVFKKQVKIVAASRTDAGVHARGQVALVRFVDFGIEDDKLFLCWNNSLPADILIKDYSICSDDFYPFKNVINKGYVYQIFFKKPQPEVARYGWFSPLFFKVDWKRFFECLQLFKGNRDFKNFCKQSDIANKLTRRDITKLEIESFDDKFLVFFESKGFLRYQIRRIIGSAFEYSINNRLQLDDIELSLSGASVDLSKLPTYCCAPQGLCLLFVEYAVR